MDYEKIKEMLTYPTGKIRVVIDTDAYNEVDDQFAIAWALRSPERMTVEAVYAAPYCSLAIFGMMDDGKKLSPEQIEQLSKHIPHFAHSAADGMEQSYNEVLRLYELLGENPEGKVYRGSDRYLEDKNIPVESEAARDLVKRAMASDEPLYVIALGAITNIASALIMEPAIRERMVVIWLGGQPLDFPQTREFNLIQDVPATQVVLDSGVPFVLIPCMTVASHLSITAEELNGRLNGKSKVGTYLSEIVIDCFRDNGIAESAKRMKNSYLKGMDDCPDEIADQFVTKYISWSRIIWDISVVGYLINPDWCLTTVTSAPILTPEVTWERDDTRHPIRICNYISRDQIFGDMFEKLTHD